MNLLQMGYGSASQGQGNQGGVSQPYGGPTGMDANRALQILNPLGLGGNGGLSKSGIEAFLDPAGIDSGPGGLNLFGKRQQPGTGMPTQLPTLGGGLTGTPIPGVDNPQFYSATSFAPRPGGSGFNAEANALAGPQYTPMMMKKPLPPRTAMAAPQQGWAALPHIISALRATP